MSEPVRVSIASQLEEARFIQTQRSANPRAMGGRPAEADLHTMRLTAIVRTLNWLRTNEDEIKAFLALPKEVRAAVLSHGETVAQLAVQLKHAEDVAKAGGPVR